MAERFVLIFRDKAALGQGANPPVQQHRIEAGNLVQAKDVGHALCRQNGWQYVLVQRASTKGSPVSSE